MMCIEDCISQPSCKWVPCCFCWEVKWDGCEDSPIAWGGRGRGSVAHVYLRFFLFLVFMKFSDCSVFQ